GGSGGGGCSGALGAARGRRYPRRSSRCGTAGVVPRARCRAVLRTVMVARLERPGTSRGTVAALRPSLRAPLAVSRQPNALLRSPSATLFVPNALAPDAVASLAEGVAAAAGDVGILDSAARRPGCRRLLEAAG